MRKVNDSFNSENLKNQMDELKKKFQEEIDKRNKLTNTIKTQMDELSKNFSEQLAVSLISYLANTKKFARTNRQYFEEMGKQ